MDTDPGKDAAIGSILPVTQETPAMTPLDRRHALRLAFAVGPALLVPAARACEFDALTLRVTHPWTRATRPGATSAAISMKFDEVTRTDRLIAVETPVAARATLGGADAADALDLLIPAGRETLLQERGVHIRLVGMRQPLELGRTYPLKLTFAHGGEVLADFSVDFA